MLFRVCTTNVKKLWLLKYVIHLFELLKRTLNCTWYCYQIKHWIKYTLCLKTRIPLKYKKSFMPRTTKIISIKVLSRFQHDVQDFGNYKIWLEKSATAEKYYSEIHTVLLAVTQHCLRCSHSINTLWVLRQIISYTSLMISHHKKDLTPLNLMKANWEWIYRSTHSHSKHRSNRKATPMLIGWEAGVDFKGVVAKCLLHLPACVFSVNSCPSC
jgi:hypothetical protein